MIYDYLVSVDMPLKLSWTPSSRKWSNEIRAKGLFGLIRTCRWLHQECEPLLRAHIHRSTHEIKFRHLDRYMGSHVVLGGTERKLRLSIDGALEGDGADLLPLMHPEKWQPNHEIAFVTASESQDCKEIVGHLNSLVHLGRSSPFLLQVCGSVRISWRRWPVLTKLRLTNTSSTPNALLWMRVIFRRPTTRKLLGRNMLITAIRP
ncbi:hypothetical protein BKA67DRAFT_570176 [Truncatella angustata]|uniref:Uncharacterized protein n=1 Tax=Truncatella angustata TaxID=152316 RepID=A0A9P8UJX2_9PEZI|nr:uncharacterized protein BKA67DRAFT_570176 [Truncatella angustata]KAH6653529.1 hypothetical protein BKA67DRAFT_570176 [Truncatella angustata]